MIDTQGESTSGTLAKLIQNGILVEEDDAVLEMQADLLD